MLLDRVDIIHYLLMVLVVLQHIFKIFCLIKFVLITFSDRFIILCNEATALKDSVCLTQESGLMREKLRKLERCQPLPNLSHRNESRKKI